MPVDATALIGSRQLILRPAESADAHALSRFASATFLAANVDTASTPDLQSYVDEAFTDKIQSEEIADTVSSIFLGTFPGANGAIVGYAHLVAFEADGFVELKRLYIDETWKGSGLASMLVDLVERECLLLGQKRLQLTVWERNPRGIAFYSKIGFKEVGEAELLMGDARFRDLLLEKVLAS